MLPTVVPLPVTAWVSDTCYNKPSSDKPMRYVSTSNLSTRAMEWVPVRDNDTQPSYEGKVARFSAVDLAGVYRDAAGYRFPHRCPVSGYAYQRQERWGQG